MTAWSYSSISTFKQCPKKYYHLKVAKDVRDDPGEAAEYGSAVHEAAELFIKDGTPIPKKFAFIEPVVHRLAEVPGDKHAELKLGIRRTECGDYEACGFFDKDVWWRGIADLLIIDGWKAYCVDYKTGKSAKYADTKQLDLLAAAIFLHFPEVLKIKSSLIFLVSGNLIKKDHVFADRREYLSVFNSQLADLEEAERSGVWNAQTSGLCKQYCPVKSCPHNGRS